MDEHHDGAAARLTVSHAVTVQGRVPDAFVAALCLRRHPKLQSYAVVLFWLPGVLSGGLCPLRATYPVVPLADRHAVSVGMTTVHGQACFGVYADRSRP